MGRTCKVAMGNHGLMLTLGVLLMAGSASGLPCNGEAVIPGDTLAEVATKCGPAAHKEQRKVVVKETDKKGTRTTTTLIEEWTFEFGPTELRQLYSFENGKVVEIRSIGYGKQLDDRGESCRNGQLLMVGDSTVDAYVKCGEPLARENKADKVTETEEAGVKRRTTVSVVEWTYRYGPSLPGYTLRFENGLVTDIRTREFGK